MKRLTARKRNGAVKATRGRPPIHQETWSKVSVVLFGANVAGKEGEKPTQVFSLRLSYIANPAAPDVFQLKQGSF